jgi:uncharacterized membrane protein
MSWDRTESWEVQRVHETRMRLRAHVASVGDLARLRALLPELRSAPPAALRRRVVDGVLELGTFGAIDGSRTLARARDLGLRVESAVEHAVRHVCFNRTRSCAILADDRAAAEQLAAEMLAAGVPLVHVEVD